MRMNTVTSLLHITASALWFSSSFDWVCAETPILISARVGSSVILPCDWRNVSSQNPHVEWRTFVETVLERRGTELYQAEEYEGRVDVPEDKLLKGNCSLVLKNVKAEDEGVYESYLVVKRTKRALQSKRVFLQSVELSVDETPEEPPEEHMSEVFTVKDKARMICNQPLMIAVSLISCLLFHLFFCSHSPSHLQNSPKLNSNHF
ncbi:uncharacterized protein [Hoplias malabaricus]|uniref:uncharacterized protein n=1 Tax=Hoplias malabaricus TaxID=27720 RepID=UPI0034620274